MKAGQNFPPSFIGYRKRQYFSIYRVKLNKRPKMFNRILTKWLSKLSCILSLMRLILLLFSRPSFNPVATALNGPERAKGGDEFKLEADQGMMEGFLMPLAPVR